MANESSPLNRINRDKLPGSKWTAVHPRDREKHFLAVGVVPGDGGRGARVTLEAVYSGRRFELDWRELKVAARWRMGWR